ncbi:MAG: DUF7453 family protein, partial [Tepidisphaeraceae bacterium]
MQRSLSLGAMIVIGLLARAGMGATYTFNKILDSGHSVPNGQAPNFSAVSLAAVDGPSTAFVGSFNDGVASYSGLYRLDSGVITTIADPTVTAPGGGGTFKSVVASGDYSGGIMVFAATTADGTQGLYRYDNGAVSLLIRQGDVLPGGTSTLVSFPARGVAGNATDYAFGAHRSDDTDGMYTT